MVSLRKRLGQNGKGPKPESYLMRFTRFAHPAPAGLHKNGSDLALQFIESGAWRFLKSEGVLKSSGSPFSTGQKPPVMGSGLKRIPSSKSSQQLKSFLLIGFQKGIVKPVIEPALGPHAIRYQVVVLSPNQSGVELVLAEPDFRPERATLVKNRSRLRRGTKKRKPAGAQAENSSQADQTENAFQFLHRRKNTALPGN